MVDLPLPKIRDPYFRVEVDPNGTSKDPAAGIWHGQHTCVSESFSLDDPLPSDPEGAILRNNLKSKHSPHFSVLRFGYLVLHCGGFPHSVMTQLTRHQDSAHLVQSGRYTGQRFVKVADGELPIEAAFYFRPLSQYQDRKGHRYEYREKDYLVDRRRSLESAQLYAERLKAGWAEEHARDQLTYNYRQNFAIAGDIQAVLHWLDQRSKADSQLEIQSLAAMAFGCLYRTMPQLAEWYVENRYGKANYAP